MPLVGGAAARKWVMVQTSMHTGIFLTIVRIKIAFHAQESTLLPDLYGGVSDDDPMETIDRPRVCSFLVRYGDSP